MLKRNENGTLTDGFVVWASFLALTLFWGSSFILTKKGMAAFTPAQVASIRLSTAALVMLPFAMRHLRGITRQQMPYVFASALTGMFIPAYLFCLAQLGLSSSIVGVLNALTPASTFLLGIFFFRQPVLVMQAVGLGIGFVGSAILILVNPKGQISLNAYAFFVIAATVCYGTNVNLVKRHLGHLKSMQLTSVTVVMAGGLSFLYLLTTDWLTKIGDIGADCRAYFDLFSHNGTGGICQSLVAAMTLGLIGTAASQLIFNRMLQVSTAVFASSITYFIPIVAVMWGVLDGEILLFWHYLGMMFIIGGVLILNKYR